MSTCRRSVNESGRASSYNESNWQAVIKFYDADPLFYLSTEQSVGAVVVYHGTSTLGKLFLRTNQPWTGSLNDMLKIATGI